MYPSMRSICLGLVFGLGLLLPATTLAAPINAYNTFGSWQSSLTGGHDNVLFNNPLTYPLNVTTGATVTGHINGTSGIGTFPTNGHYVDITGTEPLTGGPGGQADVSPNDGGTQQMTIEPNPANLLAGFNAISFKIEFPGSSSLTHTLALQVFYGGLASGSVTFPETQGKNEFYGFIADPGYFITKVAVVSADDFSHLQQIRVQAAGRDNNQPNDGDDAVPEPSSFVLLGIALATGAGSWFYRRQRVGAAPVA